MDGRHAHVGAVAAPGFAHASAIVFFGRLGARRARRGPKREWIESGRRALRSGPFASFAGTKVRQEGVEESLEEGVEEILEEEILEEDREEVGGADCAPEDGQEVRTQEDREEVGRAETCQEEGVVTECKGTQLGAQAPGQEARAPLTR